MPIIRAHYSENYFSEQFHKREFSAGLEEGAPMGSDVSSIHAALMQQCIQMVTSEIAKMDAKCKAEQAVFSESAKQF